ncbi:MAG: acyl-CoA dehydratase activase [bacterium]
MEKDLHIGLDIGSVSVDACVIDKGHNILWTDYVRHKGQPAQVSLSTLNDIILEFGEERIKSISVTGSGGRQIAEALSAHSVNEIIAQARATMELYPSVRTIIEIGGEDSKLILLTDPDDKGRRSIEDFATNSICAAGTGSFLDQQASRLGVSIEEEFSRLALKSLNPPRIAGRCSVFAKTDMIHLQQEATPDYDIIAGLCFAMARNFKSTIGKGKEILKPVSFQGGVSANLGMRRAFKEVLELSSDEFIIPEHYAIMGAIGSALYHIDEGAKENYRGLNGLEDYIKREKPLSEGLKPLVFREESYNYGEVYTNLPEGEKIDAFMGVDVGSISTNVVVIDREGRVLSKRYLMTAGRPIEAVNQGIREVGGEIGDKVNILGVGTTGSGRYLIADYIGADVVRNEITAQATASAFIDPKVDTIFEIGGQDSKFISLENGVVVDFEMNKVCAAGTGSFLEEQAEKLNVNIKEEFSRLALSATNPCDLGERCTVFMETALVHNQQHGARKEDLLAGLAYSIVINYLNRVVGDKRVGNHIFFQGGTAFNKAVISAFEAITGKNITVPPHHEVTGAIGMALIARDNHSGGKSTFKGFDIYKRKYELSSFICSDCANRCEVHQVLVENENPLYYGSRCEKYEIDRVKKEHKFPDLFRERKKLLETVYNKSIENGVERGIIGFPRMLLYHELYPFWKAFFTELGFRVIRSKPTNKDIIHNGVEAVASESCFPVKVAHGHVIDLLDKEIDFMLIPSHITMSGETDMVDKPFVCPYVQTIPYVIEAALRLKEKGVKVLTPRIFFHRGVGYLKRELGRFARVLGVSRIEINRAVDIAMSSLNEFYKRLVENGKKALELLSGDEKGIVIISRPYNGCDFGINLNLPKKLLELGVLPIPMDYLDLDSIKLKGKWDNLYWRYSQKILSAVEIVRNHKKLYPLYITNFGCGPDSFIQKYFRYAMGEKPSLIIEVDEHSADVGAITRCEAFLDSINNVVTKDRYDIEPVSIISLNGREKKTIWIPYMCDQAFALKAAFIANGVPAEVMPEPDDETLFWGRKYTTGKECYPAIITTGDMVKLLLKPNFDRENAIFFMPSGSGPCRFGQYNTLQRLVLKELGYENIPIYSPNQGKSLYDDLGIVGNDFKRKAWWGVVAIDYLEKFLLQLRPYEVNKGETERIYRKFIQKLVDIIINIGTIDSVVDVMKEAVSELKAIKVDKSVNRPKVGIVGEIYVRSNRFSNENIITEIERFGGEVWIPPVSEWFLYTNWTRMRDSVWRWDIRNWLSNYLTNLVQTKDEHRIAEVFKGLLDNYPEPIIIKTIGHGRQFVDDTFEGEAIITLGKAVDYILQGLHGIVNVMPFTCMPGTIVTAITKKMKDDYNNIPVLNMAYDGLDEPGRETRLEAFIHQARQYMERMAYVIDYKYMIEKEKVLR